MVHATVASHHLSKAQAETLRSAALYAYCINQPFNRFISIHLTKAGIRNPHPFLNRFFKLAGDWLRRRSGHLACYCWVLENPPWSEKSVGGLNAHILIHVPVRLITDFNNAQKKWVKRAGGNLKEGVLHSRSLEHSATGSDTNLYLRHGLLGVVLYLLKGIDQSAASTFGIQPIPQGVICGKRSGHSENLGVPHPWQSIRVRPDKNIWIAGDNSRRRHYVRCACPELLGLEPEIDQGDDPWAYFPD